jgi:hypothetical protein
MMWRGDEGHYAWIPRHRLAVARSGSMEAQVEVDLSTTHDEGARLPTEPSSNPEAAIVGDAPSTAVSRKEGLNVEQAITELDYTIVNPNRA